MDGTPFYIMTQVIKYISHGKKVAKLTDLSSRETSYAAVLGNPRVWKLSHRQFRTATLARRYAQRFTRRFRGMKHTAEGVVVRTGTPRAKDKVNVRMRAEDA